MKDLFIQDLARDRQLTRSDVIGLFNQAIGDGTLTSQELQEGYIFVKSDYQMVKVNLKEILYIEGLDDYIKIYLPGKSILTLMTLKTIAQKLPGPLNG